MNYLWFAIPSVKIADIGFKISGEYGILEVKEGMVTSVCREVPYVEASSKIDVYQEALIKSFQR